MDYDKEHGERKICLRQTSSLEAAAAAAATGKPTDVATCTTASPTAATAVAASTAGTQCVADAGTTTTNSVWPSSGSVPATTPTRIPAVLGRLTIWILTGRGGNKV